ncbi:MAG: amidohydrolase family protein [Deltaproteobacteria bacterium]|nr:amidohydrolase family protein [Deltaproteobacteria bacterium]
MKKWVISDAIVITSDGVVESGSVSVANGKVAQISTDDISGAIRIDVQGAVLSPGLINAHDHLLGTYYPKVGNGPYENWLPWDNDLKSSPIYRERQQIENADLYLLGGYRNLLSGVTTVSDHIPHFVGDPYYDTLPMKAVREFTMAHSIASFALAWGGEIHTEYQAAVDKKIPFVTHISEGFDAETVQDVKVLNRQGGLGEYSVLIHGIAFSKSDMELISEKGASTVWCPDSNMYMFNETTDIKMQIESGINVTLGTDSPMSGGLNLLTEMKFAKKLYKSMYGEELSDEMIFKMVSSNSAKAFHNSLIGSIKEGNTADFTLVRDRGGSPHNSIVDARMRDILLVVVDGLPAYGDLEFAHVFESLGVDYQEIVVDGVDKVVTGDLIGLLKRISRAVGFKKEFPFLPVDFDF